MRSLQVLIATIVLLIISRNAISAAESSKISIAADQKRSLRTDNTVPLDVSDDYVRKALKLRGLDDAALKAHANYRYYEFFSRKAVEYRLYKQLQRGVPTFEIWKDQGFSRIAKAVDLKQIVNTMEFKFYERYVKAFHQKVKGDLNAWRDPTAVMVARGATEAEMTARTLILVNSGMKEDYVKALLGMTKPGRPGVLLKGKELENHIDYKYLELFRNAKERLDGKQFKWENLEDIIK
ncbi:hypothetical protein JG687_00011595 [Phytophthora cactorum]|uniref:RxLR effector protein n=1 Tax=Phytophthora cactorum TaxID=29920 RepID=A0A8T1U6H4_9STRA|nr:hypothetical protein JG687_00011595 [Phytophthora cactorum]